MAKKIDIDIALTMAMTIYLYSTLTSCVSPATRDFQRNLEIQQTEQRPTNDGPNALHNPVMQVSDRPIARTRLPMDPLQNVSLLLRSLGSGG